MKTTAPSTGIVSGIQTTYSHGVGELYLTPVINAHTGVSLFRRFQCLLDVGQDVIDVLDTNRQSNHIFADAG